MKERKDEVRRTLISCLSSRKAQGRSGSCLHELTPVMPHPFFTVMSDGTKSSRVRGRERKGREGREIRPHCGLPLHLVAGGGVVSP